MDAFTQRALMHAFVAKQIPCTYVYFARFHLQAYATARLHTQSRLIIDN